MHARSLAHPYPHFRSLGSRWDTLGCSLDTAMGKARMPRSHARARVWARTCACVGAHASARVHQADALVDSAALVALAERRPCFRACHSADAAASINSKPAVIPPMHTKRLRLGIRAIAP
jgi:hypothetical protein